MTDIDETSPKAGFVIYAKDRDRIADFYTRTLGMAAVEDGDDFVVLESPTEQIVVQDLPAEIAAATTIARPPAARKNAAIKPCFLVKSLRLACEGAVAAGGHAEPAETEWLFREHRMIDACDPEGNVIRFRQEDG